MKFINRLKYFLIGFGLGLIIVFFIFRDRKWDWLPNNRVINFIIDHPIHINDSSLLIINNNINKKIFSTIINGDVDFSNSDTKGIIKTYLIKHEENNLHISVSFQDSISQLIGFNENVFSSKSKLDRNSPLIHMPDETYFSMVKDKEKKLTNLFKCQLKKYDLTENQFINHFEFSIINWELSSPYKYPNPLFISIYDLNPNYYSVLFEEGSERIRLKNIVKISKDKIDDDILSKLNTENCN